MTYIPNTIIEKARFASIFSRMAAMEKGKKSLLEVLIKLQTDQGIDEVHAHANALQCMAAVAGREALTEALTDDSAAVMDALFEKLAEKDPSERLMVLHKIHFGLTVHKNPAYNGDPATAEELFREYYLAEVDGANPPSAEELEQRIRRDLQNFRIHPASMKMLARRLKNSRGCMATAIALGESGRNLKCMMTMEHWLDHRDTIIMEQAASEACESADYQAVADGVNKFSVGRTTAAKILKIVGITTLVVGVVGIALGAYAPVLVSKGITLLAETPGLIGTVEGIAFANDIIKLDALAPQAVSKGIERLIFGGALVTLSGFAANLIGTVAAWMSGLFHKAEDAAPAAEELADELADETVWDEAPACYPPMMETMSAMDTEAYFQVDEDEEHSIF